MDKRPLSATLLVLLAASFLPGCRFGGVRSVEAENDRLRQEVADHEKKQQALQGEVSELKVKLAEASRAQQGLPAEALEALPRVASIEISSLCGFEPIDSKEPATGVAVWFETKDGRGRFVQAVGRVTIQALILPTGPGDPQQVASITLTPVQLRDSYRSSFTGTHYSVDLKLDSPLERGPAKTPSLVVRIEFQDAITGEVLKGERVISPRGLPASGAGKPG